MKKLTEEEYKAVAGLHSYYSSLDFLDITKEEKEASTEEQAIVRGLGKLLAMNKKLS